MVCFNCGQYGHQQSQCPHPRQQQQNVPSFRGNNNNNKTRVNYSQNNTPSPAYATRPSTNKHLNPQQQQNQVSKAVALSAAASAPSFKLKTQQELLEGVAENEQLHPCLRCFKQHGCGNAIPCKYSFLNQLVCLNYAKGKCQGEEHCEHKGYGLLHPTTKKLKQMESKNLEKAGGGVPDDLVKDVSNIDVTDMKVEELIEKMHELVIACLYPHKLNQPQQPQQQQQQQQQHGASPPQFVQPPLLPPPPPPPPVFTSGAAAAWATNNSNMPPSQQTSSTAASKPTLLRSDADSSTASNNINTTSNTATIINQRIKLFVQYEHTPDFEAALECAKATASRESRLIVLFHDPQSNSMLLDTRDMYSLTCFGRCIVIPYLEYAEAMEERNSFDQNNSGTDCTGMGTPAGSLGDGSIIVANQDNDIADGEDDDDDDDDTTQVEASGTDTSPKLIKSPRFPPSYLPALFFTKETTPTIKSSPLLHYEDQNFIVVPHTPSLADLLDIDLERGVVGISFTQYVFHRRAGSPLKPKSDVQLFYFSDTKKPRTTDDVTTTAGAGTPPPSWSSAQSSTLFSSDSKLLADIVASMESSISAKEKELNQTESNKNKRFDAIFSIHTAASRFLSRLVRFFGAVFVGDRNNTRRSETGYLTLSSFNGNHIINKVIAEAKAESIANRHNNNNNNRNNNAPPAAVEGKPLLWITGDLLQDVFHSQSVNINALARHAKMVQTEGLLQQLTAPPLPNKDVTARAQNGATEANDDDQHQTTTNTAAAAAASDWIIACDSFGTGIREDAFSVTKDYPGTGDICVRQYFLSSAAIQHCPDECLKQLETLVKDESELTVSCNCGQATEFRYDSHLRSGKKPLGLNKDRKKGRICLVVQCIFKASDRPIKDPVTKLVDKTWILSDQNNSTSAVYFNSNVVLDDELTISDYSCISKMETGKVHARTIATIKALKELREFTFGRKLDYLPELKWRGGEDDDEDDEEDEEEEDDDDEEDRNKGKHLPNTPLPLPSEPIRALVSISTHTCNVRRSLDWKGSCASFRTTCSYPREEQALQTIQQQQQAPGEKRDVAEDEINIEGYMTFLTRVCVATVARFLYSTPGSPLFGHLPLGIPWKDPRDEPNTPFEFKIANYFKQQFNLTDDEVLQFLSLSPEQQQQQREQEQQNEDSVTATIIATPLWDRVEAMWSWMRENNKIANPCSTLPSQKEFVHIFDPLYRDPKSSDLILSGSAGNTNSSQQSNTATSSGRVLKEVIFSPLTIEVDAVTKKQTFVIDETFTPSIEIDIKSTTRKRTSCFWQAVVSMALQNAASSSSPDSSAAATTSTNNGITLSNLETSCDKLYSYNRVCVASKKTIERSLSLSTFLVEAGPNTTIVESGRISKVTYRNPAGAAATSIQGGAEEKKPHEFTVILDGFAGHVSFALPSSASQLESDQISPLKNCHVVISRDPNKEVSIFSPPPKMNGVGEINLGEKNISPLVQTAVNSTSATITQWLAQKNFPLGKIALAFIEPTVMSWREARLKSHQVVPHTITLVRLFGFPSNSPEITRIPVLVSFKSIAPAAFLDVQSGRLNAALAPWMRWKLHYLNICNRFGYFLGDVVNREQEEEDD